MTLRADARRNRDRLLAVAGEVVAEQGADASLEEIARRAGVGSATLHRHFRSRQALLEDVFRDRVAALCAHGEELLTDPNAGAALTTWLHAVVTHAATNRGLAPALAMSADPTLGSSAHTAILTTGGALLNRAQQHDQVRPDLTIGELFRLVSGIATGTEQDPPQATRLLTLALEGVGYRPPEQ
ncbi:MAG: helix-turn-helix domain-containing protein [Umezawaea sp.]